MRGGAVRILFLFFFFFNDTATTEIYTLSLHDALPILRELELPEPPLLRVGERAPLVAEHLRLEQDRKSTRLNSSHSQISYAVFCLKKKKKKKNNKLFYKKKKKKKKRKKKKKKE